VPKALKHKATSAPGLEADIARVVSRISVIEHLVDRWVMLAAAYWPHPRDREYERDIQARKQSADGDDQRAGEKRRFNGQRHYGE
jgi:hypothetical protein